MQSTCMAAIGGEGVYLLDNLNTLPNSSEPNMYILELFDQCATYPLSLSPPPLLPLEVGQCRLFWGSADLSSPGDFALNPLCLF